MGWGKVVLVFDVKDTPKCICQPRLPTRLLECSEWMWRKVFAPKKTLQKMPPNAKLFIWQPIPKFPTFCWKHCDGIWQKLIPCQCSIILNAPGIAVSGQDRRKPPLKSPPWPGYPLAAMHQSSGATREELDVALENSKRNGGRDLLPWGRRWSGPRNASSQRHEWWIGRQGFSISLLIANMCAYTRGIGEGYKIGYKNGGNTAVGVGMNGG